MTIASCYVSPEGIVFGADSTTTVNGAQLHYFNHAQKLFEVGENSTLGAVTWGLGGLVVNSHRMLLARLADDLKLNPPVSIQDAASRWSQLFWSEYINAQPLTALIQKARALHVLAQHDPNIPASPHVRTLSQENEYAELSQTLIVGFCIGGYVPVDRHPRAYQVIFTPFDLAPPALVELQMHQPMFWGAPNMIARLLNGCDMGLRNSILTSPHWNGTPADLDGLISQHALGHAILPIRDAIDFTHACIASTIKALKFSNLSQICGGPIEIAVITADRSFRWVRHKPWDAAISDGGT